jgi:prepilin-type N-terminal cleavage/methylation domain-containing protein/prepilin-type processing-associated H-X9-DG protein
MARGENRSRRGGFTLTELLVVVGLIALLISLLLPALTKARAAANASACLSNLRQMSTAWAMYITENRGRLPEPESAPQPGTPEVAWRSYWPGILDTYKVRGAVILCPGAQQPMPYNYNKGMGNVNHAWTGRFIPQIGSTWRFNLTTWRDGSYAYNQYLTAGEEFGSRITSVRPLSEVPVFIDATYTDVHPDAGTEQQPPPAPPNLRGQNFPLGQPHHWRFLITRHGRGVNVALADGSARWVRLEETYLLQWKPDWYRSRLVLPLY